MSSPKQVQKKLLVVEDDPGIQSQLKWCFDGYHVVIAGDRADAVSLFKQHKPVVVLLDLGLPPDPENASEGLATLGEILEISPDVKVIVVTGNDDRSNAVAAIGRGAFDFYQKPVDVDVLGLIVERAYHVYELEEENRRLLKRAGASSIDGIITGSPEMLAVCRMVERVAPVDVTTMILGESGTGKELIARSLHDLSDRAKNKFVAINCAAIPETLLESELFGYEKGAFTGATRQTIGKIELANGGTLFLDEIGDLPMPLQAKLLRFLQERVIERLGGRKEIAIDVRVICATHQDIKSKIEDGTFREDLYYRLSEITINIPSLRERTGDPVLLARAFLERYVKQMGRKIKGFTPEAISAIERHSWPGNVREMENRIKRAVILEDGNKISAEALEFNEASSEDGEVALNLKEAKEKLERQLTQRALSMFNGNVSHAADALGVSRPTLYAIMDKFGLK